MKINNKNSVSWLKLIIFILFIIGAILFLSPLIYIAIFEMGWPIGSIQIGIILLVSSILLAASLV